MIQKLGGRKVIFGLLLLAVGVALDMLAPKGLSVNMVQLMSFIGVGFFLGNGVEHMANAVKKKKPSGGDSSGASKEILQKIDQIQLAQQVLNEQIEVNQKQATYIIQAAGLDKKVPKSDNPI